MIRLRKPTKYEEALGGDHALNRAILQVGKLRWHITMEEVLRLRQDCNSFIKVALDGPATIKRPRRPKAAK